MTPSCEDPSVSKETTVGPKQCHLRCQVGKNPFSAVAPVRFYRLAVEYLGKQWPKLPGQEDRKRADLRQRLRQLHKWYYSRSGCQPPDVKDRLTRLAYIFRYFPSRAYISSRICSAHPCIGEVLLRPGVSVTCFGSGPGSELLGLMATCKPPHEVTFHLVDLYATTWMEWLVRPDTEPLLRTTLQTPKRWALRKHDLDFLKIANSNHEDYLKSDLFIFSYILSEFQHTKQIGEAIQSVLRVLQGAPRGSKLLIIDNGSAQFFGELLPQMVQCGGELLVGASATRKFILNPAEREAVKSATQCWKKRINWPLQMEVQTRYAIVRKKSVA